MQKVEGFKVAIKGTETIAFAQPYGSSDPFTRKQADERCKVANADAEKMGLKTRYEVVPA